MDDDPIKKVFPSLYVAFRTLLGPKASTEELLRRAKRIVDEMHDSGASAVTWDAAELTLVRPLRASHMLYRGVRLVGQIIEMTTPELLDVVDEDGRPGRTLATALVLRDAAGGQIATLDILGEALVKQIEGYAAQAGDVEVLGRVIALPSKADPSRSTFVLEVSGARRASSTLDMLGATAEERRDISVLLDGLIAEGRSPVDFILEELIRGLGVVGLAEFPLLRQCLRFTVLQAISGGRIAHAPGTLSGLIVGPPAQGKKLIGLAARVLNPRTSEVSASKATPAGLVGASQLTPKGWRSEPGLIPRADGGAVVFQDAHGLTAAEVHRLAPMLQELTEDGVLRDATAGGVRREVSVRLLLDANRAAQVQSRGAHGVEAPILTSRPLLSRLDFIAEIPADPQRAWDVAGAMYGEQGAQRGRLDDEVWVRRLRLLVGALRDRNPKVDLTAAHDAMRAVHTEIAAENRDALKAMPDAGDIPTRLAISFKRYVTASARANGRSAATLDDVEEVVPFLRLKLDFYSLLGPADAGELAMPSAKREAHYARHAGEVVRAEDLAREYTAATGEAVSERTVRRDLQQLGAVYVAKGRYRLPHWDPAAAARSEPDDRTPGQPDMDNGEAGVGP